MKITKDVIADLLPLYYSEECSPDTKLLVEEYLRENPDFEKQMRLPSKEALPESIPQRLGKDDEMRSLAKTKWLLRFRATLMGFAIFFSLAPFSVFKVGNETHWLMSESPVSACVYGLIGIGFWTAYYAVRRRTRVL